MRLYCTIQHRTDDAERHVNNTVFINMICALGVTFRNAFQRKTIAMTAISFFLKLPTSIRERRIYMRAQTQETGSGGNPGNQVARPVTPYISRRPLIRCANPSLRFSFKNPRKNRRYKKYSPRGYVQSNRAWKHNIPYDGRCPFADQSGCFFRIIKKKQKKNTKL